MKKVIIFICVALILGLTLACSSEKKNEKTAEEAAVVESFYNAIVNHDRDVIGTIACADWEKNGKREVDAFAGTKTELVDFACSAAESGAESATVSCSGKIAAAYGTEITDFPIAGRIHSVVKENGEWRICGFE